jgi:hypothetical protein
MAGGRFDEAVMLARRVDRTSSAAAVVSFETAVLLSVCSKAEDEVVDSAVVSGTVAREGSS